MAYCFDDAVAWLGQEIEAQLSAVTGSTPSAVQAKREYMLTRILGRKSRFADPVAMGKVKRAT